MEAKKVDLAEWERFGEGANGQSYYHRTDETLVLKLNDQSWTMEKAFEEFEMSRTVQELGIRCPEVYDFVTDGERYGFTSRRIRDKRSFSRMIADDPSRIPELAACFARRAREFHSTKCDTARFGSPLEDSRAMIGSCAALPDDVRARLLSLYNECFDPSATTCLHGDFHPGNLISGEGGEYWIDLGGFGYGDSLLDIAKLYSIGYFTPESALKTIFHVDRPTLRRFVDEFLKCYYGDALDDAMMERIRNAGIFRAGLSICSRPKSAFLFIPLIRGQKVRFALLSFLVKILWALLASRRLNPGNPSDALSRKKA